MTSTTTSGPLTGGAPASRGRWGGRLAVVPLAVGMLLAASVTAAAGTPAVLHTIGVGSFPAAVALSPDGATAYVANADANTVSVINTATDTVTATVAVPVLPLGVAVAPSGSAVYVTGFGADVLSVLDPATDRVVRTIPLSTPQDPQDNPVRVVLNPAGSTAYVTLKGGAVVTVDLAAGVVTHLVWVGDYPFGVVVSPDGSSLYMPSCRPDTLTVIDAATATVTRTVPGVGGCNASVAVTPDGRSVWVSGDGGIGVVDTATGAVTHLLPVHSAGGIVFSPDGHRAYIADSEANTVDVVDTATAAVVDRVPVGRSPQSIALSPDGYTAWVANVADNTVSVVDTGTAAPPSVTGQPRSQLVVAGHRATFHATVTGPLHPTLRWQRRRLGGTWTDLPGATAASYTTPPLNVWDTGTCYRVVATNREGTATSRAAVLIVIWAHWPTPVGRS